MKRLAVVVGLIACLGSCPAYAASGQEARASFNFRSARVQDAIRLIAAQFGLNVVIGQDAGGLLTASLTNVTVEQAMSTVSDATGCEYTLEDGVLIVNPSGMQSRVFALN